MFGSANNSNWAGTFEPHTQHLFVSNVRRGDVVWDVGANVGFFTLLASRLVTSTGRVVAFEPLPRNLDLLRRHLELNQASNVQVLAVALTERPGTVRFAEGQNHFTGRLREDGALEVEAMSGDDLWARGAIPPPSLVKMDIEGGESAALAGCDELLQAVSPIILLSAHGAEQFERCSTFLRARGYRITIEKDGVADGDYLLLAHPERSR